MKEIRKEGMAINAATETESNATDASRTIILIFPYE